MPLYEIYAHLKCSLAIAFCSCQTSITALPTVSVKPQIRKETKSILYSSKSKDTVRLARLPAHQYSQQHTIITYSRGANVIQNRRVSGCSLSNAKSWPHALDTTAEPDRYFTGQLEFGQPF